MTEHSHHWVPTYIAFNDDNDWCFVKWGCDSSEDCGGEAIQAFKVFEL